MCAKKISQTANIHAAPSKLKNRFLFALLPELCTFGSQGMKCYE